MSQSSSLFSNFSIDIRVSLIISACCHPLEFQNCRNNNRNISPYHITYKSTTWPAPLQEYTNLKRYCKLDKYMFLFFIVSSSFKLGKKTMLPASHIFLLFDTAPDFMPTLQDLLQRGFWFVFPCSRDY